MMFYHLGYSDGLMVYGFLPLQILQLWLLTQNLSFMVAGGTVVALVVNPDLKSTNYLAFLSLVIVTNISGALGTLSTLAGTILIEREW